MTIGKLHNNQKFELLAQIWPGMLRADFDTYAELYDKYYLYLDDQFLSIQEKPTLYTARTLGELGDLIRRVQVSNHTKKADIVTDQSRASYNTVDIAASMWLTIHIQHSNTQSPDCFQWPEDNTLSNALREWLDQRIPPKRPLDDEDTRQIPLEFSIPNLIRYYEMKVQGYGRPFIKRETDYIRRSVWPFKIIGTFKLSLLAAKPFRTYRSLGKWP
ncbi:hypothetical protein LB506_012482 [Fusarium annulatum]|nr:hypothetical protein LB506_012482 [Fusarium annulatum]